MGNSCRICNTVQTKLTDLSFDSHSIKEEDLGQFFFQSTLGRELKIASQTDLMKPYCSIGLLTFIKEGQTEKDSTFNATGTLIMDNLVLTAAHSFFHREITQKTIKCIPISFRFQLHGQFSQDNNYKVEDYRVCPMYFTLMQYCQDDNFFHIQTSKMAIDLIGYDYALIKLKKLVPNVTFPKILSNLRQISITDNKSLVYGYPKEAMFNVQQKTIGGKIMGNRGQIISIRTNTFQHNVATSGGHSGSPVFLSIRNIDEQQHFYLIGIHSGYFSKSKYNQGALVTESMIQNIKQWQKEMLTKGDEENTYNICLLKENKIIDLEKYQPTLKPIIKPKSMIKQIIDKPQSKIKSKSMMKPQTKINSQSMFDPQPLQLLKPKQPRELPKSVRQLYKLPAIEIKPIYQVKPVKLSPTLLSKYQPLIFKFDMRTVHSQYYTISLRNNQKIIKRKPNRNYFQSKPYHLVSLKPIINGKWKISLKLLRVSSDDTILQQLNKNPLKLVNSLSQVTLIGFMNSYRKGQTEISGFIDQKQCVSICIWDQILQKKQSNQKQSNDGQSNKKQRALQHHASILIDGLIDQQYKNIIFQKECEIIIYINIQDNIILWKLSNQTLECPIPQSIFNSNGEMMFFVGLSNPDKNIEIHQPNDSINLRVTS